MSVAEIAAKARSAAPCAGFTTVLAIDGRAGAGKSQLAARLRAELDASLVTMDDFYPGWHGLLLGVQMLVSDVLTPLAAGRKAWVPRYDWATESWREPVALPPTRLVIVDGVGSGSRKASAFLSVLVWLSASEPVRKERALRRDGDVFQNHWEEWAAQEDALFTTDAPWERADLVISTDAGFPR